MLENKVKTEQQQMLEILHNAAHDIRGPLSSILQGLDFLLDARVGELNEKQRSIIHSLCKQSQALHQMLNELLDAEKIKTGGVSLQKVPAIFSHILEVTLGEMQEQANFTQVQLKLEDKLPPAFIVNTDVSRIRQVLRNLIENALRYSPKNQTITIAADLKNEQLLVTCHNHGPQIPEENLSSIFDKFFQIQNQKKLGSGLGLSICRNIVELHGGKIWAENLPMGVRFIFTLP